MPGGPWAARGSAWGDTETTLWQGVGYGTGHRAARAQPLPTVHPRGVRPGGQLGTKSPGVTASAHPHGHAPALHGPGVLQHTDPGAQPCPAPPNPAQAVPCPSCVKCHWCPWGVPLTGQGQRGRGSRGTGAGWTRASLVSLLNLGWSCLLCFLLPWYRPLPALQALDQSLAPALPKHIFPVPAWEPAGAGGLGVAGGATTLPRHPPLEATPKWRARRCRATCRQGVPKPHEPLVPGVLQRPAGPRPRVRAAWDPLPPRLGVQK